MMKTTILTLLVACFYSVSSFGQCGGNITINTQADVTAAAMCTSATNISILGTSVTSLAPLTNLTTVTGTITISGTNLTTLSGLDNLTSAAGIRILTNMSLTDINALKNTAISNTLIITGNQALDQCCAFKSQLLAVPAIPTVTIMNNAVKVGGGCNTVPEITTDTSCDTVAAAGVPTMGEWGLISLSLLLMIIGVVTIRQRDILCYQRIQN